MSNVILSPNMNLPVPIVGVDLGPDWANNYNSSLSIVDQHNHSPGSGVQINQNGINLIPNGTTYDSLNFNSSNAFGLRSVKFVNQTTALNPPATDVGCLYLNGGDLYFNNATGSQIKITTGSTVNATSSGISSGTASASFSTGILVVNSAALTSAPITSGAISISQGIASANAVTIQSPNSLAASYSLTFPTRLPSSPSFLFLGTSGNLSASNTTAQLLTLSGGIIITGGTTTDTLTVTGALVAEDYLQLGSGGPEVSNVGSSIIQTTAVQLYLNSSAGSAGLDGSFGLQAIGIKTDLGSASFPIVVSAAPSSNGGVMIVRGTVAASASSLASGEGATVSYNSGTELYTVSFNTAFGDTPAVVLTPHIPGGGPFSSSTVVSLSASGFTCSVGNVGSGFVTSGFSFIAIGQRGA